MWNVVLIPIDSNLTPYYIYRVLSGGGPRYRGVPQEVHYGPKLAARALKLFAQHPYREHFAAFECRAIYREELADTDGKGGLPRTLACVRRYLQDYPQGRYRDELQWLQVQLENWHYEFEGYPDPALHEARAFEGYIAQHPQHAERAKIELRIAHLYSVAYELIREKTEGAAGFSVANSATYRARAESLYVRLRQATDPTIASEAAVALFNLRTERRIYVGPNAW